MTSKYGKIGLIGILILTFTISVLIVPGVTASKTWIIDSADPYDGYPAGYPQDVQPGDTEIDLSDPGISGTGLQGIYLDTLPDGESIPTIGQYIQNHFPDIWNELGAKEKEHYNSMPAVWHVGASAPVLPKRVNDLIATGLARKSPNIFPKVTNFTAHTTNIPNLKAIPVSPNIGLSLNSALSIYQVPGVSSGNSFNKGIKFPSNTDVKGHIWY